MRAALGSAISLIGCHTSKLFGPNGRGQLQGTSVRPVRGLFLRGDRDPQRERRQAVRALIRDDKGRYREPLLPPGEYELRVKVAGFQAGGC